MAYGLKYIGEFTGLNLLDYKLQILEKDYTGLFYSLQMAGTPVIHNWNNDDPKAAIKASSLTIKYVTSTAHPIDMFYSNEDDRYKVILQQGTTILFEGFLVQDDFSEPMVDYNHEVTLTANDGIGTLKDIALDLSNIPATMPCVAQKQLITVAIPNQYWIYLDNINFTPVVGTPFTISGHPDAAVNGTYTPVVVTQVSATKYNVRVGTPLVTSIAAPCIINGTSSITSPTGRHSILDIVKGCLQKTGLELISYFYFNLWEDTQANNRVAWDYTYLDADMFYSGDKFDNCYNVLEKICSTFNASFFQANGSWNFVRWDELRLTNDINAFVYTKDMAFIGQYTLPSNFTFGFNQDTYPEAGLTKFLVRPYEFVKHTFNYQQPKYLLKNYDLQKVGLLLRTYNNVGNTIQYKEYVATDWLAAFGSPISERFIRVGINIASQKEVSRELVVRGLTFDTFRSVQSMPIELSKGDRVKFSFTYKTNISQPGSLTNVFAVRLFDGVNNRYVDETPADNGAWVSGIGFNYTVSSGDNTNTDHTVTIESSPAPFDGLLYCYLAQCTNGPQDVTKETIYKDIRLEVTAFINDSTKITGHVHKDLQGLTIKNNRDEEIIIDDSPRNSIQGTMFTYLFDNILQNKTSKWSRKTLVENKALGEIITREILQYKSIGRTKLEGSFFNLKQGSFHISPLTWFNYTELAGKYFIFGNLEIDYYRDKVANCTAWELYKEDEEVVNDTYSFNYLYDTK